MSQLRYVLMMSLFSLVLFACSGSNSDAPVVTFSEKIQPLMQKSCVGCHSTGGIAPFSLETYAEVSQYAEQIQDSMVNRRMPPWGPLDDGTCGTYKHSRALSQQDFDDMSLWIAGGKVESTGRLFNKTGPQAASLQATSLTGVSLKAEMPVSFSPTDNNGYGDDYRCFAMDITDLSGGGVSGLKNIDGFEVFPGDATVVHHVVAWAADSDTNAANYDSAITTAESLDPEAGWSCFGGHELDNVGNLPIIGIWAPGVNYAEYPEGTGIELSADSKVVIQVHYNVTNVPTGATASDQTHIKFRENTNPGVNLSKWISIGISDSAGPGTVEDPDDGVIFLPAGRASISESRTRTMQDIVSSSGFTQDDYQIWAVTPHMHLLGRSMTLEKIEIGANTCVNQIPVWDFNWQDMYFFNEQVSMHKTDELKITCTFNTESKAGNTVNGDGTDDEMCVNLMYITPVTP